MIFLFISFLSCIFSSEIKIHLEECNSDGFKTVDLVPQTKKRVSRIEIMVNKDVQNENAWSFAKEGEFRKEGKSGSFRSYKVQMPSDIDPKLYIAFRVHCEKDFGFSRALYKKSKRSIEIVPIDPRTGKYIVEKTKSKK
ncbi:hypothetical protein H312_02430 [Anncaliia algerae PRA339]|uniref:Uncharacterized protein n=1 Tax=Anncaliia algerae PRA339 TaxID=1288291 RepID=A0A059EZ78_9MICR|nr:hypothetical protein H312_02430 [Anncaliia algerae PRA339]